MKEELVFVKSNFIGYNFKKLGEYVNPDKASFDKAIEHKIFMSPKQSDTARANKKMLCSFLTVRVIGNNSLMTVIKDPSQKCVVLDIPVTRGMFKKSNNELAFLEAVKCFLSPYLSVQDIQRTHIRVSGVLNYATVFGIHYTLYVTPDIEKQLRKSSLGNGKSYRISKLQSDLSLDGISQMCIKNYKEVTPNGENN